MAVHTRGGRRECRTTRYAPTPMVPAIPARIGIQMGVPDLPGVEGGPGGAAENRNWLDVSLNSRAAAVSLATKDMCSSERSSFRVVGVSGTAWYMVGRRKKNEFSVRFVGTPSPVEIQKCESWSKSGSPAKSAPSES